MPYRLRRYVADHWVMAIGLLVLLYLFVPIAVVAAMSFRDAGRNAPYTLQDYKFTWTHWAHPFGAAGIGHAFLLSIGIALLATLGATVLGTLMSFALARHKFRGRAATNTLIFLPMATPEIVLGASLLTLFLNTTAIFQLGFVTIFIAHVMFIVSFVVVTVKARLIGFDRHLEEAAMDLGANEVTTFRKVTLPLIAPAMLAAALLGFALSIDDFVITYFNAGATQTFPIFVWGIARVSVPPQVNVIASAIFIVAIALALGNVFSQYRSAKRTRGAT
jgi:spermidine/putrescine transport system permease protein